MYVLRTAALGDCNWWRAPQYLLDGVGPAAVLDFGQRRYALPSLGSTAIASADVSTLTQLRGASEDEVFAQFTASSTSTRTRINEAGSIVADLSANQPRWSRRSDGRMSLLLEAEGTDLVFYSNDLANAGWSKTNQSVGVGGTALGLAMSRLARTSTAATSYSQIAVSGSLGVTYTVSVIAAATAETGYLGLRLQGTYPDRANAVFNLVAGTVRGTAQTSYTGTSATITPIGAAGQYRCTLTTTSAGTALARVLLGPTSATPSVASWEGAASDTVAIDVAAVQLEASAFASSYIPTSGAAATRLIETDRNAAVVEALLGRSAATVLVQGYGLSRSLGRILGGAGSDALMMQATSTSVRANKTSNLDATFGAGSFASGYGTILAFDSSGRSLCANGGTVASDASGVGDLSTVYLGRDGSNTAYGDGHYDALVIWPFRAANASLPGKAVAYA